MSGPASQTPRAPIAAAGVVCLRGEDVLLIRRGTPPLLDRWTLPGGKIEWGERAADAALRELKEETSIEAELIGLVDVVDGLMGAQGAVETEAERSKGPTRHYVLIDYAARWLSGEPKGGDDAADARFFSPAEINKLGLWSETLRVIAAARAMF